MLASGTARREALDEAIAEIEAGHGEPSPGWKVRFALMLGLERVLSEKPPRLASGTELRRHQVDALAGMLTELIAANQGAGEEPMNGNGQGAENLIDAKRTANANRHILLVAGRENNPLDSTLPKLRHRRMGIFTQRVVEQQETRRPAINGNRDAGGGRIQLRQRRRPLAAGTSPDVAIIANGNRVLANHPLDTRTGRFDDGRWGNEDKVPTDSGVDQRGGEHMT